MKQVSEKKLLLKDIEKEQKDNFSPLPRRSIRNSSDISYGRVTTARMSRLTTDSNDQSRYETLRLTSNFNAIKEDEITDNQSEADLDAYLKQSEVSESNDETVETKHSAQTTRQSISTKKRNIDHKKSRVAGK